MGKEAIRMEDCRVFEDAWRLVKHVSQLSVWESDNAPEMVKIGRERLNFRRKMEIKRLSGNLKEVLCTKVVGFVSL